MPIAKKAKRQAKKNTKNFETDPYHTVVSLIDAVKVGASVFMSVPCATVLVALWDKSREYLRNVGSGFIADEKCGLIVTAAHLLFDVELDEAEESGIYYGLDNAAAVVGLYNDNNGSESSMSLYIAEILTGHDLQNVDVCVLRTMKKFKKPIPIPISRTLRVQSDIMVELNYAYNMNHELNEGFSKLEFSREDVALEMSVAALGFSFVGGGIYSTDEEFLNPNPFSSDGKITKPTTSATCRPSGVGRRHCPLSEIAVDCPLFQGCAGGPCVNSDNEVVGIMSRAIRGRVYLAPSKLIMPILESGKRIVDQKTDGQ